MNIRWPKRDGSLEINEYSPFTPMSILLRDLSMEILYAADVLRITCYYIIVTFEQLQKRENGKNVLIDGIWV